MEPDFPLFLRKKLLEQKMPISKFCDESGMSRRAFYNLLENKVEEAKLSTLIKLAQALYIHPMELLSIYFKDWNFSIDTQKGRTVILEEDDDIGFIDDITFPDHTVVTVHQKFTKTWRIQNTGKVVWKERKVVCVDDRLRVIHKDGEVVPHGLSSVVNTLALPEIQLNEQYDISINFIAPSFPCTVVSHWKMVDNQGSFCFPENAPLSCLVKVISL